MNFKDTSGVTCSDDDMDLDGGEADMNYPDCGDEDMDLDGDSDCNVDLEEAQVPATSPQLRQISKSPSSSKYRGAPEEEEPQIGKPYSSPLYSSPFTPSEPLSIPRQRIRHP